MKIVRPPRPPLQQTDKTAATVPPPRGSARLTGTAAGDVDKYAIHSYMLYYSGSRGVIKVRTKRGAGAQSFFSRPLLTRNSGYESTWNSFFRNIIRIVKVSWNVSFLFMKNKNVCVLLILKLYRCIINVPVAYQLESKIFCVLAIFHTCVTSHNRYLTKCLKYESIHG